MPNSRRMMLDKSRHCKELGTSEDMISSLDKEKKLQRKCYPNIGRRKRDMKEVESTMQQRTHKKSLDKAQEREDKRMEKDNKLRRTRIHLFDRDEEYKRRMLEETFGKKDMWTCNGRLDKERSQMDRLLVFCIGFEEIYRRRQGRV